MSAESLLPGHISQHMEACCIGALWLGDTYGTIVGDRRETGRRRSKNRGQRDRRRSERCGCGSHGRSHRGRSSGDGSGLLSCNQRI